MGECNNESSDDAGTNVIFTTHTKKVGLAGHCHNEGMRKALSEASLFVSQSREFGGIMALYLINLMISTDDPSLKMELKALMKNDPTGEGFLKKCANRYPRENERLHELAANEIMECCDFDELGMNGKSTLLDYATSEMSTNAKNHVKNLVRYQKYALETQVNQIYPNLRAKKRRRIVDTLSNMINNVETFNITEECDSEEVLAIVDKHRSVLGLGPMSDFRSAMEQYHKSYKAVKFKKGKGRTNKPKRPNFTFRDGTEVSSLTVFEYFAFCLRIQEEVDGSRRFHIFPRWKGKHSQSTMGDDFFYHLLMEYGDDNDREQLKGYTAETFCNHPIKHSLWSKYFAFEQYECDNDDCTRIFNYEIATDGLSISFNLKTTYHNNPRELSEIPDKEADACNEVVDFGEFSDCHPRCDGATNNIKYTECCTKIASTSEEDCCPKLREFDDYATSKRNDIPPLISSSNPIAEQNHDRELAPAMDCRWGESTKIENTEEHVFYSACGKPFTPSTLRGRYFWYAHPGHGNMLCVQLYHLSKDYELFTIGDTIDVEKQDYSRKAEKAKRLARFETTTRQDASMKTTSLEKIVSFMNIYGTVYTERWEEITKPRHRRLNFGCYIMKNRSMDRLAMHFAHHQYLQDGEVALFIMGDRKGYGKVLSA